MRLCTTLLVLFLAAPMTAHARIMVVNVLDEVSRGTISDYRVGDSPDKFTDALAKPDTPSIDAMANDGLRFTGMVSAQVCSGTRAELYTGIPIHRPGNLYARSLTMAFPSDFEVEIDPTAYNIFRALTDAGESTAFFGKWHVSLERASRGLSPGPQAWGVDYSDAVKMVSSALPFTPTAEQLASSGHYYWVEIDPSGNAAYQTEYLNKHIGDTAEAYILDRQTNDPTGDYVIFIGWVTHSPLCFGVADTATCTNEAVYNGGNPADDRPPGSTATSFNEVFFDMVEDNDARIGSINALLDLAGDDMSIVFSDNGLPNADITVPSICFDSRGLKHTPYPCGVAVPLIAQGGTIRSEAGGETIPGLYRTIDLAHTIVDLAGGSFTAREGRSFADCMRGTGGYLPSTCWENDAIGQSEWRPLGGNTDGTIQRMCLPGDPQDEWDDCEYAAETRLFNGHYLLHRVYDADAAGGFGAADFCEDFFSIDDASVTKRYLPSADAPTATTTCPTGGAIDPETLSGDEKLALECTQRHVNAMLDRNGALAPTFAGVSF